jgi:hypothetical protein
MKRSDALPSASRNLQVEVGVTEFSWIPAYTPDNEEEITIKSFRL